MNGKKTTYIVDWREAGAIWRQAGGVPELAVIAAFGLVSLGWFRGEFGAVSGYDFATSLKPLDEIRRALYIWDDRLYAGAPNFIATATLPYLLLQHAFERTAGSLYRGQMLFFTLLLLLPGFTMRSFLRGAFEAAGKRNDTAFFGSLFYMLNTFVFVKWNRGELIALFAYGMLPLYLAIVDRGLKGPVNARFAVVFICAIFFYPASLGHSADFVISTVLICGYAVWRVASSKDVRVLKRAVCLGIAAAALSSWWALPFLFSIGAGGAGGAGLKSFAVNEAGLVDYYSSWARLLNVMKLWFSPIYPTAVEFGLQFYRPGTVLIPLLAFSSLLFKRDGRVIFFSFAAITGLWLSKGTSPPLGGIYRWMYSNVPYFFVFRAPSRCFPLVYTLALSVLIGYSASSIRSMAGRLRGGGRISASFGALVVLLILFNAWPLLYRDAIFRTREGDVLYPSVFVNIPPYYEEMNGWLRERMGGYRLHSFHDRAYLNYTWGYSSTDIAPKVIEAPQTLMFSQELTFGSGGFQELMLPFSRRFWSWDFGRADRILGLFGVRYISSTGDVMRRYLPDTNYYEILPGALASMDGISLVKEIGEATIYENSRAMPAVYAGSGAKALFADAGALVTLSHTEYLEGPLFIRVERIDQANDMPMGSIDELVMADRNFYDVLSESIPVEHRVAGGAGAAFRSKGGPYAVRAKPRGCGPGSPVTISVDGRPLTHGAGGGRFNGIRWADLGVIDAPEGWHNVSIEPPDGAEALLFVPVSVWESEKMRVMGLFRESAMPLTSVFRERVGAASRGLELPVFVNGPYSVEASFTRGVLKGKDAGLSEDYVKDPSLPDWSVFGGGEAAVDSGVRIAPGVGKGSVRAAKRLGRGKEGYVDIEEYPFLSIRAEGSPNSSFDAEATLGVDFDNDGWADDAIRLGPIEGGGLAAPINLAETVKRRYGYPGRPAYRALWMHFDLKAREDVRGNAHPAASFRVKGMEFYRYVPVAKPDGVLQAPLEISAGKGMIVPTEGRGARMDVLPAGSDGGAAGPGVEDVVVRARHDSGAGLDDGMTLQDIVVKVAGGRGAAVAPQAPPEIEWRKLSPVKYSAIVKRPEGSSRVPFWMVLNTSYDTGWRAYILKDGKKTEMNGHYQINGFANGWWVENATDAELTILMEFAPQRWLFLGAVISISSSLFLIGASVLGPLLISKGRPLRKG